MIMYEFSLRILGKTCDYGIHWKAAVAHDASSKIFEVDRKKVHAWLDCMSCESGLYFR